MPFQYPSFDFDDFLQGCESKYTGNKNTNKIKLSEQLSDIGSGYLKTKFETLFFEAKTIVDDADEQSGNNLRWGLEDYSNFQTNLRKGGGGSTKAAALHFLLLTKEIYLEYAKIMNSSIFGSETIEHLFSDEDDDNGQPKSTGGRSGVNKPWKLRSGKLQSIDEVDCTIQLETAQQSNIGEPQAFLAKFYLGNFETDCGISYGFRRLGIRTSPVKEDLNCDISYNEFWEKTSVIGNNVGVRLIGTGDDSTLELQSINNTIFGKYELSTEHVCSVNTDEDKSEIDFEAKLLASKNGLSISQLDGSPLDDGNKKIIIAALIAKHIGNEVGGGWIPIAIKPYRLCS